MENISKNISKFIVAAIFALITVISGCQTGGDTEEKITGDLPFTEGAEDRNEETAAPVTGGQNGDVRLSFLAAGDNIVHTVMLDDAAAKAKNGGSFDFSDMYKNLAPIIRAADIAFVNIESPIAGDDFGYSGYPMFNTPKEAAFALVDAGFDIVGIANNHMLDKWEQGYKNQINFWAGQPVLQLGGFVDKQDFETVRIYEKNGVSIAFLSYTYGTNGMELPAGSEMVVPYIDYETIKRQVKSAKPLADLLIVVMHWGQEDAAEAGPEQKNLARMMAECGVDAVIGMHPHVLQKTEWIDRPEGGKTLAAYSIGNFISGMLGAKNMPGGLLAFDIVKKASGETSVENAKIIPVITHYRYQSGRTGPYLPVYSFENGRTDFKIYNFEDYTPELAAEHGVALFDPEFSYDYIKNLIMRSVPLEFLGDFYKNQSD